MTMILQSERRLEKHEYEKQVSESKKNSIVYDTYDRKAWRYVIGGIFRVREHRFVRLSFAHTQTHTRTHSCAVGYSRIRQVTF